MSHSPFHDKQKRIRPAFRSCQHLIYQRDQLTEMSKPLAFCENVGSKGMETVRVDSRYLASAINTNELRIHDANIVLVKSDKGTGKTQWLRRYLKTVPSYRSVLLLTHRRSLARTLSKALQVKCYLDDSELHWRYTLSLDSLINAENIEGYDVLVIDESEQVFRHLIGDTTKDKRERIFNTLIKFIRYAKQIICCDADLTSELTSHLLSKLRDNFEKEDRVLAVVNQWKSNRSINVFESKYHALAKMVCDVESGKRVYVPVGEKVLAAELQALLKYVNRPNGQAAEVLLLTGDTSNEGYAMAFFADPNGESQKYDVLIATSTLSTGVSIDVRWFDAVYGLFDGSVYTFQDCDQAISRVRDCQSINIWIHPGQPPGFQSEEAIRNGPKKKELITRRLCMPGETPQLTEAENLYLDVDTRISWCEQNWKTDRRRQFIELKEGAGWQVKWVPQEREWDAAGRGMRLIGKDPTGVRKYKPIVEAENLLSEEFEILKNDRNLSASKKHAVKKYQIAEVFGLASADLVTLDHVVKYHENDIRGIIRNIKLISESQEFARYLDRSQRDLPNGQTFTLFDHRAMKHHLFSQAIEIAGINPDDILRDARKYAELKSELERNKKMHKQQSRAYRIATVKFKTELEKLRRPVDDTQLAQVAHFVSDNLRHVNMFLGARFQKPDIPENRKKVFNAVLGKFGVAIKLDRRMVEGIQRSEYIVDYDRVVELAVNRDDLFLSKVAT